MIMMANDIRGWLWPSFPDICLTVEEKPRKKPPPGKLTRPGMKPVPAWREATILPLGHSGGRLYSKNFSGNVQSIQRKNKVGLTVNKLFVLLRAQAHGYRKKKKKCRRRLQARHAGLLSRNSWEMEKFIVEKNEVLLTILLQTKYVKYYDFFSTF